MTAFDIANLMEDMNSKLEQSRELLGTILQFYMRCDPEGNSTAEACFINQYRHYRPLLDLLDDTLSQLHDDQKKCVGAQYDLLQALSQIKKEVEAA